jgi:predicted nucleic acid-binding protein
LGGDRIILDSSAVSAFASKKSGLRVALRKAIASGTAIFVPAPVVTETTTGNGSRDAQVNHVLKACLTIPLDDMLARAAGALRFRRAGAGAIDAMVVACADAVAGSVIITGDVDDLRPLAEEHRRSIVVDLNRV